VTFINEGCVDVQRPRRVVKVMIQAGCDRRGRRRASGGGRPPPFGLSVEALDLRDHLAVHVLELLGVLVAHLIAALLRIREDHHATRGPLGLAGGAELLLGVNVDVGHVRLLAQDGDVSDDVDRGDVARDDAKPVSVRDSGRRSVGQRIIRRMMVRW